MHPTVPTILENLDNVSDIHIEPQRNEYRVRLRQDGLLSTSHILSPKQGLQLITQFKTFAKMDISQTRLPQDGHLYQNDIQLRISTQPTYHGEKLVARILPERRKKLDELGFSNEQLLWLQSATSQPHGLILLCGPTGCGKSTTLYSILNSLNLESTNIVTIEDPIEQTIQGVNQTQLHTKIGLTFASAIRMFLRHDPDIIVVGEIRDSDTATACIQAAQTGHLVLSTLHSSCNQQALARLANLGIEMDELLSVLKLCMSQRLIRLYCTNCSDQHCRCCQSGYCNRTGIFEIYIPGQRTNQSLRQSAEKLVHRKLSSQDEVDRVLGKVH